MTTLMNMNGKFWHFSDLRKNEWREKEIKLRTKPTLERLKLQSVAQRKDIKQQDRIETKKNRN